MHLQGNTRHTHVCHTGGRELAHAGKLLARQGEQSVRHCPDGDPRTRAKPKLVEDVLHVIAGRAL